MDAADNIEGDRETFRRLLNDRPLYKWQNQSAASYRVLVLGFGQDAQAFLDVCLEASQSLDSPIDVKVWSRDWAAEDAYLKSRPLLEEFFQVAGREDRLTGESYGRITFLSADGETPGSIMSREDVVDTYRDARYVYVSLSDAEDNERVAQAIMAAGEAPSVNVRCLDDKTDAGGVHYVRTGRATPVTSPSDELDRMAFNVHLVWSESLNADLERKRTKYNEGYYRSSCLSNVLSIRYKLHYLGIELSEGVYEAARKAREALRDATARRALIATEHRRWVVEKICTGWTRMSVDECLRIGDTKDKATKRHVCLVRSDERPGLDSWGRGRWDAAHEADLARLDPLDRMSVELHQAHLEYARNHSIDYALLEDAAADVQENTMGDDSIRRTFDEWYENLREMCNDFSKTTVDSLETGTKDETPFLALHGRLHDELVEAIERSEGMGGIQKKLAADGVERIYRETEHIIRCLRYHDYKKNDADLIDNIPFILTYSDDITMLMPADHQVLTDEKDHPTQLFAYVAAATIVNPRTLYLPYVRSAAESETERQTRAARERAIADYLKGKGLQTEARFIPLDHAADVTGLLGAVDGGQEGWLLVEQGMPAAAFSDRPRTASYAFDMTSRCFDAPDAPWLNDIHRHVGLTAHDIATLVGRKVQVKNQPSLGREDSSALYRIYRSDPAAWKVLCTQLMKHRRKAIAHFAMEDDSQPVRFGWHYLLPRSCTAAARAIVGMLRENKIIDARSHVADYSTEGCRVHVFGTVRRRQELDGLFSQPYLLSAERDYGITDQAGRWILWCDALMIDSIPGHFGSSVTPERVSRLLDRLQSHGLVSVRWNVAKNKFNIIYGSREIKDVFMKAGNLLEAHVFYSCRMTNAFDDIVTGVEIFRPAPHDDMLEHEIDCLVTRGFQTAIVECKAWDHMESPKFMEELSKQEERLRDYGVNGIAFFVVDGTVSAPAGEHEGVTVWSRQSPGSVIDQIGDAIAQRLMAREATSRQAFSEQ